MKRRVQINRESMFKALILLGFSTFLLWLVLSGGIGFYINPRFTKLTMAAAVIMLIMFLAQAGNSLQPAPAAYTHNRHRIIKLAYLPFVATLLLAFLFPNSPLDASMASKRDANLGARQGTAQAISPKASDRDSIPQDDNSEFNNRQRNPIQEKIDEIRKSEIIRVTEDNFTIVNKETYLFPELYAGKEISMLGFVYKETGMQPGQFALGRYVITCCSADASFAGFLCEYDNTGDFKEGDWLTIRGTIKVGQYNGSSIPVILVGAFNKTDQEPANPYIY
ncbi:TIGR03943 family putative permease subunit [Pelotomaculum propionicicum]|nr:TIGR03943 family protein [Pelotomaculum propionicicum]